MEPPGAESRCSWRWSPSDSAWQPRRLQPRGARGPRGARRGPPGAAGAAAAATAGAVPRLRLPATASPLHYRVELTLVPAAERFTGAVAIDLLVEEPAAVLWLNATALTIEAATLTAGSTRLAAGIVPGGAAFVGFR